MSKSLIKKTAPKTITRGAASSLEASFQTNFRHHLTVINIVVASYFIAAGSFFTTFWWQIFRYNAQGDLEIAHPLMYADWALHFTLGSSFLYRSLWLTESPFFVGSRLSYPFAANWVSAVLIKVGVPWLSAFTVPSYLLCLASVVALYWFLTTLFKSRLTAVFGSLIFFANGGWGVWQVLAGLPISEWSQAISQPTIWYTDQEMVGIKWINVIHSMFVTQRALTFGFPLTLITLTLVLKWLVLAPVSNPPSAKKMICLGAILGILPLIHTHSFLVATGVLCSWLGYRCLILSQTFNRRPSWAQLQPWLLLGISTLVIAVPIWQYFFMDRVGGFIRWQPGWLAGEYQLDWLTFWWRNWGITPYLAILGGCLLATTHKNKSWLLLVPFMALFMLCNLFIFQPWEWDNTKFLIWSSVGISGLAGWSLRTLLAKAPAGNRLQVIGRSLVTVCLLLLMTGSGLIDIIRLVQPQRPYYVMYSAEELALAEWAKQNSEITSRWATDTRHNHWLYNLTGRQALMAYPGWLWSHGYDFKGLEADVDQLMTLQAPLELYQQYQVDYVVIDTRVSSARQPAAYLHHIHQTQNYKIYRLEE